MEAAAARVVKLVQSFDGVGAHNADTFIMCLKLQNDDTHRALVLFASDKRFVRAFRRFQSDEARAYLASLLSDLLSGSHAYELKCESVFDAQSSGEAVPREVEEIVERRFGPYFARRLGAEGAAR